MVVKPSKTALALTVALISGCEPQPTTPVVQSPPIDHEVRLEDIYGGAWFTNATGRAEIILIETHENRFLYAGNGGQHKLYSTFYPARGGTPEEVCANLRGSDYKYAGKAR